MSFENLKKTHMKRRNRSEEKLEGKHRRKLESWKVIAPLLLPYFKGLITFLLLFLLIILWIFVKQSEINLQNTEKIVLAIISLTGAILGYRSHQK